MYYVFLPVLYMDGKLSIFRILVKNDHMTKIQTIWSSQVKSKEDRPLLLGEKLDAQIAAFLKRLCESKSVVNMAIVMAKAEGIVLYFINFQRYSWVFVNIFKPGVHRPVAGAPGFLKLILCGSSACVCVCLCVCPEAINN